MGCNFREMITAERFLASIIVEDRMSPGRHQEKLKEYVDLVRILCHLQHGVSVQAWDAMESNDLVAKWQGASLDVRQKHVLIGIAGACGISPNLNHARLSCAKELRVSYLSTDGSIFLDLLNAIAPHDLIQSPTTPQYINNDEWDKVQIAHKNSQDEVEMLALSHILVLRTKLITHALHFIMCSFLGHELPQISVHKKAHSHNKTTPNPLELLHEQALLAQYGKERFKEMTAVNKAAFKERVAHKVIICCGCGGTTTNRETFKRCGACWKIDREVLYCSKECQRANWKQHKLMCGKSLDYDTAVKLATSPTTGNDASDILPPANGFKPTIELLMKMKFLKENPLVDYVVFRTIYTNGEKYAMMAYTDPKIKTIFRRHRDNAMKSGDRVSVALICDCVLWDIEVRKAEDFRTQKVIDQFIEDYKFPKDELEKVLGEMGRYRASIHNRFPALFRPQI